MTQTFDSRYRVVRSRDARFDGWFFTAVTSTGIHCRPSCPAVTREPRRAVAALAFLRHAAMDERSTTKEEAV